ncbi:CLUMA_CG018178, isoform A [Clunio marinus]|uniref:CLUMA_CG018178, isoform A n=1 Tax=Clunio marinus TaxID=568069 RepID=A0A1J1IXB3_9DIPT|nr:CLUMA_CG018178, isoform A [Clunio marinus]
MEKLESIREEDYGQCDSPKAKKVFINMLDSHMHSPMQSKAPKMKPVDGKSINLSSPCSYTSSSPSSTSSLSSTSNVQHQKQAMVNQALNGSMHDILNMPNFNHLQQMQPLAAGLQNLTQRSTPLNLGGMSGGGGGSPLMSTGLPIGLGLPQSPQMPQLVLASGQLGQGIQGAQVLIPTSQGITSQTILTIPVSQQLPTNLTIDQLLQALSHASQKQQSNEAANNTNHVLSNVPNLSPNPILLNSHLLANGAQQLLSIQPQLLALQQQQQLHQQQQQSPESHPFYRKLHHGHMEPPEMSSPPLHTRKDQMSINTFKMRNREMNKRLARMSRPLNGHGEMNQHQQHHHHQHHQMETESHSPQTSPRVATTNGETSHCTAKPVVAESSHPSPTTPKSYHQPPSPSKSSLDYRAMRELLAEGDKRMEGHFTMEQSPSQSQNGSQLKINQSIQEKTVEKTERELSPPTENQQQNALSSSPMQFSNDSNSGDGNFDELQNEGVNIQREGSIPEGIDLDEINEFAQAFKLQRLSLGLTQTQVGQALSVTEGPAYSQSAICSALAARMYAAVQLSSQQQQMFEKLDITPKSAQKIKPVLEQWMKEAKGSRFKMSESPLTDFMGVETSKKRKRRTSFTPHALEILNSSFERNTHPSGTDITSLAQALGYEREVIRIWFCNKRQALKNTVRMMSKGMPN